MAGLSLVTASEYKAYMGINSNTQDTIIASIIPKVSDLVKNICRRSFVDYRDDAKIDVFKCAAFENKIFVKETPILFISSVEFSDDYGQSYSTLTEFSDYVVVQDEDAVEFIAEPYISTIKSNAFRITYTAGFEELPQDLKLAVFDLITYYMKNDAALHSNKSVGSSTTQIEYITNTALPAHIRRVLDLHTAYYV